EPPPPHLRSVWDWSALKQNTAWICVAVLPPPCQANVTKKYQPSRARRWGQVWYPSVPRWTTGEGLIRIIV
ncbi:hypothetical protein B484DRAFT_416072, partial [Ochromonadaceae sp. CCMP2298]